MPPPKAFIILPKASKVSDKKLTLDSTSKNGKDYKFKDKNGNHKHSKGMKEVKHLLWYQQDQIININDIMLVDPDASWYGQYKDILTKEPPSAKGAHSLELSNAQSLEIKIASLYKSEHSKYLQKATGTSSDQKWMSSVISAGTWSDKIAALALKVQEAPFYNLEALDMLLGIAVNKDLRTSGLAVEALKDLFLSNLLPDRPLHAWAHMPFKHLEFRPKHALLAWYEKELKARYSKLLEVLEKGLKAQLPFFRKQALATTHDLLSGKPEQEGRLLYMLVNKLGDSEGPISCKASELLQSLCVQHAAMQAVVIYEVRVFMQRALTNIPQLFAAVTFLTQIKLRGQEEVALALAECYLSLFEAALQAKEKGSRLLSALLKGINKVFPLITQLGSLVSHVDTIFRLAHTASSQAASTQALLLLSHLAFQLDSQPQAQAQASDAHKQIGNRFYQALYARLIADQILKQSNNTAFLNLLFRSMKLDPLPLRASAFLKRLMLCCMHAPAPLSAGLMLIVSEVLGQRPELLALLNCPDAGDKEVQQGVPEGEQLGSCFGPFDADKRDPRFACASESERGPSLFELSLLRHHFHPSVKAFAGALLMPPHGISFGGDPLLEFGMSSFLDRFAYKNPKQRVAEQLRQAKRNQKAAEEQPINLQFNSMERAGSKLQGELIAPEKHFFFKYFADRSSLLAKGKMRRRRKTADDEDGSEDGSEEDEDGIDAFADQLAKKMVSSSAHNDGDDGDDMEDDSEGEGMAEGWEDDGLDEEEEGDEAVDLEDFRQGLAAGKRPHSHDSDEDSEDEPEVYMDSDEESAAVAVPSKGKGKGKEQAKKKARLDDFADADEYEEEMDANVKAHSLDLLEKQLLSEQAKGKGNKKAKKGGLRRK